MPSVTGVPAETYSNSPPSSAPEPIGGFPSAGNTDAPDEARWLAQVYQGPDAPQLSLRAVLTGGAIGMLMSIANLYTVLKIGIGFGVALTACVLSFVTWNLLQAATGGRLRAMTILENNCMQTTASAAGFTTGTGAAGTFAALLILDPAHRQQPWWVVAAFIFTTGMLGVLLAIPIKRLLINQERLPFPSGTAAAATLRGLYARSADALRGAVALGMALVMGIVSGILTTAEDQFAALGRFFEWMRMYLFDVHLPGQIPAQGFTLMGGKPVVGFGFDPSLTAIGFGMLVGPRVAFSMLAAGVALYFGIAPWLQGIDAAHAGEAAYVASIPAVGGGAMYHPLRWSLWGAAALLVFASLTSLAIQWRLVLRAFRMLRSGPSGSADAAHERAMAQIEVPGSWMFAGLVPIGLAMLALQIVAFHVAWWAGLIAIVLTFALGIVASRAVGETDIAPTGALGKLVQLVFALIAPASVAGPQASVVQNVFSAGVSVSSGTVAAELLSDLKTGYLLGAHPRKQFAAQMFGVLFGTLICVPAWFLLIPDITALERYPAPAARIWIALAQALTGGIGGLPLSVLYAALAGAVIGILLPILEKLAPRLRPWLPSAIGLGMGWMVPFSYPLSFAIGAGGAWIWSKVNARSEANYRLPVASGWIAGESIITALLAMLASALGMMSAG